MTKSTASYVNNASLTAAQYVAWQGVLSAQLNNVLTKTTDTGQITNFNVAPVATARDYEVFRFADSPQTTAPIFIKVNWSMDTTGFSFMNVSVGTSTNGAGTLGGVTTPTLPLYGYTPGSGLTRYVYASSDGSQLVFVANLQAPSATTGDSIGAFIIERTRDADGTPNGTGYMVYHWKGAADSNAVGATNFAGVYPRLNDINAVQPGVGFDYGVSVPNIGNITSALIGSTAYAFPVYGYATTMTGASKALMLGFAGDFPKEVVVGLTHYGTTMNFLPLTQVGAPVSYMPTGVASSGSLRNMCPLVRWE